MGTQDRDDPSHGAVIAWKNAIQSVVFDEGAVERPIEADSQLALEIAASTHEVAEHFLRQLPQHCTMLAAATADALEALDRLDPQLAFSGVVLVRGLLEAAADLYWLSAPEIEREERTRRTFLVFLRQHETQVRQIIQFSKRVPSAGADDGLDFEAAVAEGWESLRQHAEDMAAVGYELRTSNRPGSKYSVGEPKPSVSELVDRLISDHLGTTAVPVYSLYSSVAHAEGEGLGTLRVMSDRVETAEGPRYRRGFDEAMWREHVLLPATRGAAGAFSAWARLAYPARWGQVDRPEQ